MAMLSLHLHADSPAWSHAHVLISRSKFGGLGGGLKPGISLAAGAFCEFALALVLHLTILWSLGVLLNTSQASLFAQMQTMSQLVLGLICEV